MKPTALIGHRGVGKTSLLARYAREGFTAHDLDREIEKRTGRTVSDIFHQDGEAAFRRIEAETFRQFSSGVIAVGAGFPVETIGPEWHCIWVRRATDEAGRIFTDRPRLDSHLSALDEFLERARLREPKYAARADAVLILDEGIEDTDDPAERDYIQGRIDLSGATLTVLSLKMIRPWNVKYFELRDDLLTDSQIDEALSLIPREQVLLSYRRKGARLREGYATDWALELGTPSFQPTYLSLHTGKLEDLRGSSKLKAALPTETFSELLKGHRWQMQDPANRVFLPMSKDGRWSWYRNLRRDYSLNFVRESDGSASDQPTILQWMRKPASKKFAAVLGDPVKHSRTPMEQREFFARRGQPVFAIKVPENEFTEAIAVLKELGLTDAAVTAPLKHKAAELIGSKQAVNTLHFGEKITGTNTDLDGMRKTEIPPTKTQAVWGGGGTLEVIAQVFPKAQLVSARTGRVRESNAEALPPDLVIWAASLKHGVQTPPNSWKPKYVFDLNYSEASPARDYAVKVGAKYISGLAMFKVQAQSQREFWEKQ